MQTYVAELGRLYAATTALWQRDPDPEGFEWIDCTDREQTVISYLRKSAAGHVLVVLNFTPAPRENYRIGVPTSRSYRTLLSSDDSRFGGSGMGPNARFHSQSEPWHGRAQSLLLTLPPLAALILEPVT